MAKTKTVRKARPWLSDEVEGKTYYHRLLAVDEIGALGKIVSQGDDGPDRVGAIFLLLDHLLAIRERDDSILALSSGVYEIRNAVVRNHQEAIDLAAKCAVKQALKTLTATVNAEGGRDA